MRHKFAAIPLAALAALLISSVALAGGWAQVTVKDAPSDPPAGGQTIINLNVLQHGVTAVSWPRLMVIATDTASGAVVRTDAQAKGPAGSYVATIVFPKEGEWTLTFESKDLMMEGSVKLSVAPAIPPVAAVQPAAAAPSASTIDAAPLLFLVLVAAVALAIFGLFVRNARASGAKGVSVRT